MSPSNTAASVKARLQNMAREMDQRYNDILQRYGMERFLYRLSQSDYADKFVLKGALLFMVWDAEYERRTTMDIDLLGFTDNSLEHLGHIAKTICETEVEDDGLNFHSDNITVQRIKEDADYEGVRILTVALLERSRIHIQIDIGFGDTLVPGAIPRTVPTLLDFPAPELRCYHQLTVIAEKFQAMVKLGELNSRMKDFYDIWNIIQHQNIDGAELQKSCVATFEKRDTALNLDYPFFTDAFVQLEDKQIQWSAFVRKQGLEGIAPSRFEDIATQLQGFFRPMVETQITGGDFSVIWRAGGSWE